MKTLSSGSEYLPVVRPEKASIDGPWFRRCLETIGWSIAEVARQLDCSRVTVWHWEQGRTSIPSSVAAWLSALADHHTASPPPSDWRRTWRRKETARRQL